MPLTDPAFTVPPPGPPGPYGTLAWLRATVSRFASGELHTRRRALAESLLASLDPPALRAEAKRRARAVAAAGGDHTARPSAEIGGETAGEGVALPYVPVAVLAARLGVAEPHVADAVAAVRVVAAAYHPGTSADGADAALGRLLALLPGGDEELAAQRVALLVQTCEATAALVRGALERPVADVLREAPPVPATRRVGPDGRVVSVPLAGRPFGEGPRRCPGEAHALALVEGVIAGAGARRDDADGGTAGAERAVAATADDGTRNVAGAGQACA
ncbi:MAG TPA: hypothetical protein VNS09_00360 [Solirubrobacter sp.]|nr:hypothetical protein [Solirubrobacter sp.]